VEVSFLRRDAMLSEEGLFRVVENPLLFWLSSFGPVSGLTFTFKLLRFPVAWAVLLTGRAYLIPAVVAHLLAAEAPVVLAVADPCDCVLALAELVVLFRKVSLAANEALN
jgi:hypothetical protein